MKYFSVVIIVVLSALIVWLVFFSGFILKKTQPKDLPPTTAAKPVAVLETNLGEIRIVLDEVSAPQTAANFKKLISENFYAGLTFHRIIPGFVIQGGDPKGDGTGGPGYTLPAEIKLPHKRGAVAMARLSDAVNPARESSGSQFYIALKDLPDLDGQYTVFGQVADGMGVVDQIAAVKTDISDRPLEPMVIKKAYLQN